MYSKIYFAIVFLCSVFYFEACSCNCGKTSEDKYVKGYITVVGNAPFMHLAIRTDDGKNVLLQCSKELENELMNKQGAYYYIVYGETKEENNVTTIVVDKIVLVNKNENK